MAFYSIIKNGNILSGEADTSNTAGSKSPYNYLDGSLNVLYQTNTPFSLNFTCYEKDSENPFRLTILSPDFFMNTVLSKNEFENVVLNRPLHQHDTYELVYILKGELIQKIENIRHKYTKDSCCFINRNIRHTEEYNSCFHSATLSLSRSFLQRIFEDSEDGYFQIEKQVQISEFSTFLTDELMTDKFSHKKYIDFIPRPDAREQHLYIYSLLNEITNIIMDPSPGSTLYIKALIYQILHHLDKKDYYSTKSIQLGTRAEAKLFANITHLMEQTNGRISRSELSQKLNYSGNYINSTVQKYTGMSIFEYGMSFTMQKASWMLINTTKTISEIINELSFSDRTHFYKQFEKEYGVTPKKYRIQSHSNS